MSTPKFKTYTLEVRPGDGAQHIQLLNNLRFIARALTAEGYDVVFFSDDFFLGHKEHFRTDYVTGSHFPQPRHPQDPKYVPPQDRRTAPQIARDYVKRFPFPVEFSTTG